MTTEAARLTPVGVGDVLAGKYAVERVLGSGGMGVVVAAKHLQLGERVAIKFLLPQALKKAEVVQRFEREARAAVRIKSEHVARIFDVGKLEDGAPYMVMELLDGADLSTVLKTKGALRIDLAVDYVLQACEAIAEAHSLGIVHRDLKPANLFVAHRADGSPVVKVIDFGISKVVEPEEVEMTKTDVMMGSPVYMAPEQMISARDVDVRADVWSLGVILFYLIMGHQPFKGTTVTQLYASIIEGPPEMCTSRPDVPQPIEQAVMRCLHAQPKDRWANVAEFALAVAEYGTQSARISAERVARTLGVVAVHKSAPPPPVPGSVTPTALANTGLPQNTGPSGSSVPTPPGVAPEPNTGSQQTQGSWGGTQGPTARAKSRALLFAIGGVVVLGLVAAGVVAVTSDSSKPSPVPASDISASSTAPIAPVTIGGTTSVTPAPTVEPQPSSSASSAPTFIPSAAITSAPRPSVTPTTRGTTTSRPASTVTKPKGDLFSDPH
ncbi:MAG: protein kinase [Polyangiaceae bacterium]|nr:protein kinase [Polyangiaceae bacterium]